MPDTVITRNKFKKKKTTWDRSEFIFIVTVWSDLFSIITMAGTP